MQKFGAIGGGLTIYEGFFNTNNGRVFPASDDLSLGFYIATYL